MLRSVCHYSDAYFGVKDKVAVADSHVNNSVSRKLSFKNDAPLTSYILKISDAFIYIA